MPLVLQLSPRRRALFADRTGTLKGCVRHDQVIGWANASVTGGALAVRFGYVAGKAPRDTAFRGSLHDEVDRMRGFLGLEG